MQKISFFITFILTISITSCEYEEFTHNESKNVDSPFLTLNPHINNSGISETNKLTASDSDSLSSFGDAVAVSGDFALVGARTDDHSGTSSGAAYIFERNHGGTDSWGEVKKLTPIDGDTLYFFGHSVAIDGDTALIGAYHSNDTGYASGAAYIFERNHGGTDNWGEVKKLIPLDTSTYDECGNSVAISKDTVIIGSYHEDDNGNNAGAAYIFERNSGGTGNWGEVKKLMASDGSTDDIFGNAVTMHGNTALVAASGYNYNGPHSGFIYFFERNYGGTNNWGEIKKQTASDVAEDDFFGSSVALNENFALVGASGVNGGIGATYILERNSGGDNNWGEIKKLTPSNGKNGDHFGHSVSLSENLALVSAVQENSPHIFEQNMGGINNWGETKKLIASDAENNDYYGREVSLSGNIALIGSPGVAYIFTTTDIADDSDVINENNDEDNINTEDNSNNDEDNTNTEDNSNNDEDLTDNGNTLNDMDTDDTANTDNITDTTNDDDNERDDTDKESNNSSGCSILTI